MPETIIIRKCLLRTLGRVNANQLLKPLNTGNPQSGNASSPYRYLKFFIVVLSCFLSHWVHAQTDPILTISSLKKMSLEELLNIQVVTASGMEQKISEAPSTMLVITSQQITERGYQQLDDVLRDIPGVDLVHVYGQAPTFITFRGMYGDENRRLLFMIDGIVENNINGGYEMAGSAYSLHNAERIEIIWGPASALYGANAFSAVINVITKKGADINGLQYQKGYGSFDTSVENILLGVSKSNIELTLSGSRFSTDGPRFANRHPRYNNSYVDNAISFNGNIIYTLKNIKTTLGARFYQTPAGWGEITQSPSKLLGFPLQGNDNTGNGGVMQSDFNGEKASLVETFARTAFLQTEYTPNTKFTLLIRGQYRETGVSDKSYTYANSPGRSFLSRSIFAYDANRIKGEVSANYDFTQHHSLSGGVQISQDNLERGLRGTIPDAKFDTIENIPVTNIHAIFKTREFTIQNNLGAYLQYVQHTKILKKTDLTLGGRYDDNSVYGTTINPRLGLVNQPHEKITFKLLYGSAFRAPTNFELYTASGSRIASPDLKPERIHTYELNVIYTPIKTLLVQANLFQNDLTDIIIQEIPVDNGKYQSQNVGTATIKGLEAKLDIIPSNAFSAFLNFTYQEGTQNNGIIRSDIPNIAKMKGNMGVSIPVAELLNINLIENWVGKRSVPLTNPLGSVSEYFSTNLAVSTNSLFNDHLRASLTIRNLLNRKFYDPGIRAADGNYYPTVVDQPGINVLFKIAVSVF